MDCFRHDSETGGDVYQKRRITCLERYGVPSVVVRPDVLAKNVKRSRTPEANARRRASIKRYWTETDLTLTRGLVIKRSKAEIECLAALSKTFGPCESPKQVNGMFIDGYFTEHNLYVQFDGVYWHSLPHRKERDERENEWFKARGLRLERVTDVEWRRDPASVVRRLCHSAASSNTSSSSS